MNINRIVENFISDVPSFGIYGIDLYNEKINIHAHFFHSKRNTSVLKFKYEFQNIVRYFEMDICCNHKKRCNEKSIFELFYDTYLFEEKYGFVKNSYMVVTVSQLYKLTCKIIRDIFRSIEQIFFEYNEESIKYARFYMKNNYGNLFKSYGKCIKYMACANILRLKNMKFNETYVISIVL